MILTAAFEIQGEVRPTTSLPQPQNLVAKLGSDAGESSLLRCGGKGREGKANGLPPAAVFFMTALRAGRGASLGNYRESTGQS